MAITTGIVAGVGTVGSGILSSIGAGKANSAAQQYYTQALNFEKGVYSDATTNLSPWISGGQSALAQYEGGLGLGGSSGTSNLQSYWDQFTKTPYYTFPMQQTEATMNQQAASKGLSLSGGQLASLGKYASGYASSNWNSYMDSLNKLSNLGESASGTLGQIGSNISSNVAQTSNQQASTAASSIMSQYGGYSQALQGLTQALSGSNTGSSYGSSNNSGSGGGSGSGGLIGALSSLFGGSSGGSNSYGSVGSQGWGYNSSGDWTYYGAK